MLAITADAVGTVAVALQTKELAYASRPYLSIADTLVRNDSDGYRLQVMIKNYGEHPALELDAYYSAFEQRQTSADPVLFLRRVTSANDLVGDHQFVLEHRRPTLPEPQRHLVVISLDYKDAFEGDAFQQFFVLSWDGVSSRFTEASISDRAQAQTFAEERHHIEGDVSVARVGG